MSLMEHTPKTIGERVRYARERRGLSALELAKRCDVTRSAVYQIESGVTRSPTPQTLFKIAEATSFNPEWLATGGGIPDAAKKVLSNSGDPATIADFATINRIDVGQKLGNVVWFTDPSRPLKIASDVLEKLEIAQDDAVAYDAVDDAMSPSVSPGDTMVIDTADRQIRAGRLMAILYAGEVIIRRTHIEPDGTLVLLAEQQRWPQIRVAPDKLDAISVIGRVRYRMGHTGL